MSFAQKNKVQVSALEPSVLGFLRSLRMLGKMNWGWGSTRYLETPMGKRGMKGLDKGLNRAPKHIILKEKKGHYPI